MPHGVLQCFEASSHCQHISSHGLHLPAMPVSLENSLSHIVTNCTKPIINCWGRCENGSIPKMPLHLSLIVLICLLTSPTCSFVALIVIFTIWTRSLTFLNSTTIKIVCMVKQPHAYSCNTLLYLKLMFLFIFSIHSTIISPTPLPYVIRNGIPLMNILYAISMTILFCSMISFGISTSGRLSPNHFTP